MKSWMIWFDMVNIAAIMAVIKYKTASKSVKYINIYVIVSFFIHYISAYLWIQAKNNLYIWHLYTAIEMTLITIFFVNEIKKHKNIIILLYGITMAINIINSVFIQGLSVFNSYSKPLEGILIIVFCLIWFYNVISEMQISKLEDEPAFWINAGFLVYFSGSVLLFAVSNYIFAMSKDLNAYIWGFHALFSNLKYTFIVIGLWKVARLTK